MVTVTGKKQFLFVGNPEAGFANQVIHNSSALAKKAKNGFIEMSSFTIHHHIQAAPACFIKE